MGYGGGGCNVVVKGWGYLEKASVQPIVGQGVWEKMTVELDFVWAYLQKGILGLVLVRECHV